ncbi:MAG TPA: LPS export ABC transporter periplasmic protein LptC [Steroidobacteraceae bacterium]|nr:LPS export ABC transporter periplasmic protein LptC [Steroidobacteraceae bacterium]
MIFRIFATVLFIAIIVGSFWLGGQQREPTSPTTVENSGTDLGYSARNATLIETGPDGQPLYTLYADVIRQRPGDGVNFDQVRLNFRDAQGQDWTARADSGQLMTETGKVDLLGDVHIDGVLPGSTQSADLATQMLTVDTREDIISTTEPVVLTSAGRILKSRGLTAALKDNHLQLESNVHGTFSP